VRLLEDSAKAKFFIPGIGSPERAERMYHAAKDLASQHWRIGKRRLHSITFRRGADTVQATVGEREPRTGQTVMMILDADDLYLVFTMSRGVILGDPMEIRKDAVCGFEEFEAEIDAS
jgi:hypothetical protein